MGNSVAPMQKGFLYQAYYFWLEAVGLFEGFSKVRRVGYEINGSKAFDDVHVHYSNPIRGERGESVDRDVFQLKFHIDLRGSVGFNDLMDPSFIGASKFSFLQRLKSLHDSNPQLAENTRFYLFTNWPIKTDDPLSDLTGGTGGEIRIEKLKTAGGATSRLGKVREDWKSHLNISDDESFYKIISTLRLRCGGPDLEKLKKDLSQRLHSAGFTPIDPSKATEPYSSLIFRLCHEGKTEFSKEDLLAELIQEQLIHTTQRVRPEAKQLGVRSFLRYAERMENETEAMVPLEQYFDGRFIRSGDLWNKSIKDELTKFVDDHIPSGSKNIDIALDTHTSIAFAFGSLLDLKRSVDVGLVQKGAHGTAVWKIQSPQNDPAPAISVRSEKIDASQSNDVAVVINITRSATNDVRSYIAKELPNVSELVEIQLESGTGQTRISDANHAWNVALTISEEIKNIRTRKGAVASINLFSSAPNAVVFFLGRMAAPFGKTVLYEFDFERKKHGSYEPSIILPW
jgi:hypothetical protein